jgi:hypothetical protein
MDPSGDGDKLVEVVAAAFSNLDASNPERWVSAVLPMIVC